MKYGFIIFLFTKIIDWVKVLTQLCEERCQTKSSNMEVFVGDKFKYDSTNVLVLMHFQTFWENFMKAEGK